MGAPPRRRYRSQVRAEQAGRTRGRVAEAARGLFLERGYAATSIAAVAGRAGVAPETVYAAFGSKRRLLEAVVERAGEEGATDLQALLALPGVEARLLEWTRQAAAALEQWGPVEAVIRAAAGAEPELAGLEARLEAERFASQRAILEAITAGVARMDIQDAADTFSALASPDLHHLLRHVRGWSEARYQRWLEATVLRALLNRPTPRG